MTPVPHFSTATRRDFPPAYTRPLHTTHRAWDRSDAAAPGRCLFRSSHRRRGKELSHLLSSTQRSFQKFDIVQPGGFFAFHDEVRLHITGIFAPLKEETGLGVALSRDAA